MSHWAAANGQCRDSSDVPEGGWNLQQTLPGMSVLELCEKGKVRLNQLKVGREGACINFGLLGRCSGCKYKHEVCTVATSRQREIVKAMEGALATMKATAGA
jgi:hypothetical protein